MLVPSYHPSCMGMAFLMKNAEQDITLDQENTKSKDQKRLKVALAEVPKHKHTHMHFPSVTVLRSAGEKKAKQNEKNRKKWKKKRTALVSQSLPHCCSYSETNRDLSVQRLLLITCPNVAWHSLQAPRTLL